MGSIKKAYLDENTVGWNHFPVLTKYLSKVTETVARSTLPEDERKAQLRPVQAYLLLTPVGSYAVQGYQDFSREFLNVWQGEPPVIFFKPSERFEFSAGCRVEYYLSCDIIEEVETFPRVCQGLRVSEDHNRVENKTFGFVMERVFIDVEPPAISMTSEEAQSVGYRVEFNLFGVHSVYPCVCTYDRLSDIVRHHYDDIVKTAKAAKLT